ncbi:ATP dependent DNA ligase [Nocardia takedensis]
MPPILTRCTRAFSLSPPRPRSPPPPSPSPQGAVPSTIAASARWLTPRVVGEVAYRERTGSGLRHPSWRGLRFDRAVDDVIVPDD